MTRGTKFAIGMILTWTGTLSNVYATHSDSRKAGEGTICRNDRSCERANHAALPWPWSI